MRPTTAATAALLTVGLLAPAMSSLAAADAAPAAAGKPAYVVKAKIKSTDVIGREDTVVVRGKVKPRRAAAGTKVVLQQRLEGQKRWKKTDKVTIKRNGRFKLVDKPRVRGERSYRVLKPGGHGFGKGYGEEFDVVVSAWVSLPATFRGPSSYVATTGTSIGTEPYPLSVQQVSAGLPGYAEFTLGRQCTKLQATYALNDLSETGSTGTIGVLADGQLLYATDLALGGQVEKTLDVTDVFRLRVDLSSSGSEDAPYGYAVLASPRALCS